MNDINRLFGLKNQYKVFYTTTDGAVIEWNNIKIYENETYSNKYFYDTSHKVKANIYPGYEFKYWEINGEKMHSEEIEISSELVKDNKIEIILHTAKKK